MTKRRPPPDTPPDAPFADPGRAIRVDPGVAPVLPVVVSSPHSGRDYPAEFVALSRLDRDTLRRSEDSFVEELFGDAPVAGAPLLQALFPRAYCDPNREAYELDPTMFADALPDYVNTRSPRVAGGLGTIARVVSVGHEIHSRKLTFAEALERIESCWRPYHEALSALLSGTLDRFGHAILLDCHSMPSVGGWGDRDRGRHRPDVVLGNRHGTACAETVIDTAATILDAAGLRVVRNVPYAGGFNTQHYGRPAQGVHALQVEINRALYMDELRFERTADFARLRAVMDRLVRELGALDLGGAIENEILPNAAE
ncbi:N-formylglutamate amidohydrolase [Marinibaculum pumilum]|uniref:N-formylglutamate amidohydrolase n=1 Tax=Marinibaculum pumilum TaxID=1766165 RepID=A0ABV7KWP2_9PROT